ncbi:MAG: DUF4147 domain-containing protein [Pirellulaceae bacterium]
MKQSSLSTNTFKILTSAIEAVSAPRLIANNFSASSTGLIVSDLHFDWDAIRRLVVVGFGKASGAMAESLEKALDARPPSIPLTGWINVPDEDRSSCRDIHIHHARPTGENLPTERAFDGTREIIKLTEGLEEDDLCFVLVSGGGSALLTQPAANISLTDKRATIKRLAAEGATIEQLNLIRQHLSEVKGGGLASRAKAGRVVALIISDVLGDPLEFIASGPTVQVPFQPQRAIETFHHLDIELESIPESVRLHLVSQCAEPKREFLFPTATCNPTNVIVGSMTKAVEAACAAAQTLGFEVSTRIQTNPFEDVETVANQMVDLIGKPIEQPHCFIDGGEPILKLCSAPGRGGRNQQLVMSVIEKLLNGPECNQKFELVSAGTDGEDGNTPIAGAMIDDIGVSELRSSMFNPAPFLASNDAFSFFNQSRYAVSTGPTSTNVGDLRILIRFPR